MRIFVTGATGFIGSNFLNVALEAGHEILALKRKPESATRITLKNEPQWLIKCLEDVVESDLEAVDLVLHLAAHSANVPYDDLATCLHWNLIVPLQFFERARRAGIKNYIATGTCFEYGLAGNRYDLIPTTAPLEPTQSYPASKAAASIALTQWAREHHLSLSLMRLFQVYGPGEQETRLWPSLCRAAKAGRNFAMTKGEQVRDFIHVEKVASILLQECLRLDVASEVGVQISNVGSGRPLSINEFSSNVWSEMKANGKLLVGTLPYRDGEVMRFVPEILSDT